MRCARAAVLVPSCRGWRMMTGCGRRRGRSMVSGRRARARVRAVRVNVAEAARTARRECGDPCCRVQRRQVVAALDSVPRAQTAGCASSAAQARQARSRRTHRTVARVFKRRQHCRRITEMAVCVHARVVAATQRACRIDRFRPAACDCEVTDARAIVVRGGSVAEGFEARLSSDVAAQSAAEQAESRPVQWSAAAAVADGSERAIAVLQVLCRCWYPAQQEQRNGSERASCCESAHLQTGHEV